MPLYIHGGTARGSPNRSFIQTDFRHTKSHWEKKNLIDWNLRLMGRDGVEQIELRKLLRINL